ncbi:MAG TPA: ester cyclase [Gemmatimonadaceae bacterium]|nr:ester cyclase [Gemmatimonadaceae bacterium]
MNITEKKALSRRSIEAVWNDGKLDAIDNVLAPNFRYVDPSGSFELKSAEEYKKYVQSIRKAFPDINLKIDEQIAEGDTLVSVVKITATHEAEFLGVPPSHKKATIPMVVIEHFEGDKVANVFALWDTLTFLRTAGAFEPAMAGFKA